MKKRYTPILITSIILILSGGWIINATYNEKEEGTVQDTSIVVEQPVQEQEIKEKEIRLTAGLETDLQEAYANYGVNAGIALALEQTSEQQEGMTEESEYSDFAIANVTNYVNVRSTPSTDGEVVGKMYDDSVAQILSVVGEGEEEWFQIISGSVEGYIKSEYFICGDAAVEVIEDYITRYAVVKADRLNVRKEPDITAARIGYMDHGEKGKVIEIGEEWTKILYAGEQEGYVASEYITIEEQFIYAKSIEEELKELEAQRLLAQRSQESEVNAPENTAIQITPPPTDYANVSELRSAIVNYAMQYLGNRYISGGQSLEKGTDCSGFTCYIYALFGISLSRIPQGQWEGNGRYITAAEVQPGDIVCYSSSGGKCTHVGIYIGDGQIIHSANSRKGVIISNMYYDNTFIGIKNVID